MKTFILILLLIATILSSCSTKQETAAQTDSLRVQQDSAQAPESISTDATKDKSAGGGFALVYSESGEPAWDPVFLELLDAGVIALFFADNSQVFGKGVGFDMDSYYLTGTYRILPAEGDESLQKIAITGEVITFIEGMGEQDHEPLNESVLQLKNQNGKMIMSSDFTLFKRFDKSSVIKKDLTGDEIVKAKASFVR